MSKGLVLTEKEASRKICPTRTSPVVVFCEGSACMAWTVHNELVYPEPEPMHNNRLPRMLKVSEVIATDRGSCGMVR